MCQTDWIQIRSDILSGLIMVQSVRKGYEQTTLEGDELISDYSNVYAQLHWGEICLNYDLILHLSQRFIVQTLKLWLDWGDAQLSCYLYFSIFLGFTYKNLRVECSKF